MAAFNAVRFRVKPGQERKFIEAHQKAKLGAPGFRRGSLIKTGERTFCMIGEWDSFEQLVAARPAMAGILETFRDTLEDFGGGRGVTDPVSGEVVAEIKP